MQIEIKQLGYTYLPKTPFQYIALKNVSLSIEAGKFYSIIGHTGSGKSTLVQHINALLIPTTGSVTVNTDKESFIITNNKKQKSLKQLRKHASIVFQFPEYQLFEENVLKDVSFGPKNFGVSEKDAIEISKKMLSIVGLDESYYLKSPFSLSGGEKRRVAIAGILALDPGILILDEPTAGLDPQGSVQMMELFQKLNSEMGKTIILVTHDMNHVIKHSDQVIIMKDGQVVAIDEPIKVFYDEKNLKEGIVEQPTIAKIAHELSRKGLKVDFNKIKDAESLVEEIARVLK